MTVTFQAIGGVGEYGKNCFYIEGKNSRILLDCGIKRGTKTEYPEVEKMDIKALDAVFLSHIHDDHCIGLPLLYKQGYKGNVIMSEETKNKLPQAFKKWRHDKEKKDQIPYSTKDEQAIQMHTFSYETKGTWIIINDHLRFQWFLSGHVIGGVSYLIQMENQLIYYSGDFSNESLFLQAEYPTNLKERPDLAIIDSGHANLATQTKQVQMMLNEMNGKKRILFPVPKYGRGIELLSYITNRTERMIYCDTRVLEGIQYYLQHEKYLKKHGRLLLEWLTIHKRIQFLQIEEMDVAKEGIFFICDPKLLHHAIPYEQLGKDKETKIILTDYIEQEGKVEKILQKSKQAVRVPYKVHQNKDELERMMHMLQARENVLFHSEKVVYEGLKDMFQQKYDLLS